MSETGTLRNSFGRTDKAQYILKKFSHRLRIIPRQKTFKLYDQGGLFILGSSQLGINAMRLDYDSLEFKIFKYNDESTFIETFETPTFMDTVDWTFDKSSNELSITTNDVVYNSIVNDERYYQRIECNIEGENTDITDNLELYIVDDNDVEHLLPWGGSVSIDPSLGFGLKIKNTGTAFTTSMYNDIGKPMIMYLKYN